ncbi:MAG: FAD-dependent oxidoreductase, partial [Rhodoferax sp.]
MKIIVLGGGIIGVSTAWHLLERGHEVTVVERRSNAALETSFANAGQISVSYCEPWASRDAPLKLLKWMFRNDAPLLFRPQLDWQQWRWGLRFLGQCNDAAFERNVRQIEPQFVGGTVGRRRDQQLLHRGLWRIGLALGDTAGERQRHC